MKITAAIIDDDTCNVEMLKSLILDYHGNLKIVFTSNNIDEATKKINLYKPNVLFLDIKLASGSAFDLLSKIEKYNYIIVFISADNEHVSQLLKYNTAYFISKPLTIKNVSKAVSFALEQYCNQNLISKENSEQIIKYLNYKNSQTSLAISGVKSIDLIDFNDILYLKSDGRYTEVYLDNESKKVVAKNLGEYEIELPHSHFIRTHKSYIVNWDKIKWFFIEDNFTFCKLSDGTTIPVSKRKYKTLLQKIKF